jgi:hypothetical protein
MISGVHHPEQLHAGSVGCIVYRAAEKSLLPADQVPAASDPVEVHTPC